MQTQSSAPHTTNQQFTPSASAAGPATNSPTGDARAVKDPKMPMARPNDSCGMRFCMSGRIGALKTAVAAKMSAMIPTKAKKPD